MARSRQRLDRDADGKIVGDVLTGRAATVRMTPALRAYVDEASAAAGLAVGAYIRQVVVDATGAPPEAAAPTKALAAPIVVTADLAAIGQLERSVRRLNGAIIQLSKSWREADETQWHLEAEQVLADLTVMRRQITAIVERIYAGQLSLEAGAEAA